MSPFITTPNPASEELDEDLIKALIRRAHDNTQVKLANGDETKSLSIIDLSCYSRVSLNALKMLSRQTWHYVVFGVTELTPQMAEDISSMNILFVSFCHLQYATPDALTTLMRPDSGIVRITFDCVTGIHARSLEELSAKYRAYGAPIKSLYLKGDYRIGEEQMKAVLRLPLSLLSLIPVAKANALTLEAWDLLAFADGRELVVLEWEARDGDPGHYELFSYLS